MQDNPRIDRMYDRTRVDGDFGIQRGSSIVLRNPRQISKSGSDMPLILHYGIALSVIITDYIPMSRLQSGYNSLPKINGKNKI